MNNLEETKCLTVLSVGEVAARSGVAVSTLHFYEAEGLIRSWRNQGNQRRYAREVLRRIAVIRVAQRAGISLAAIRDALKTLPDERTPTAEDWKRLSRHVAGRSRPANSSAGGVAGSTGRLHWLRLPFPRRLPAAQSMG